MKLIDQSSEVWGECPTNINDAITWIECAGRVCYRSEDKIVEGSGKKFVDNIIKRKHYSVIEHSNLVVRTKEKMSNPHKELIECRGTINSPYIQSLIMNDQIYSGGNFRAWIEQLGLSSIDELFERIEGEEFEIVTDHNEIPLPLKMVTVEFTTDRAVTHELVRHRPASYSQESQRYVPYGNIKFIKPSWFIGEFGGACDPADTAFIQAMKEAESSYVWLRDNGKSPQDARVVLPNQTATKIAMTASIPEWNHVFNMRCSKAAYQAIRNLMFPVVSEFGKNKWIMPA